MRSRRLRVGRALRHGRPIAAEDMTLAIEMAKDTSARLKVAYFQGFAFVVMLTNVLWQMSPWSRGEVLLLAGALVAFVIYAVGMTYGRRVQRWLRQHS